MTRLKMAETLKIDSAENIYSSCDFIYFGAFVNTDLLMNAHVQFYKKMLMLIEVV